MAQSSSQKNLRVISLVPSWTETLIEAGVNIVGRTRYCIHPTDQVISIPTVGGTKHVDWQKVRALKPDLLILDREENPKDFAEQAPCTWWASDIRSVMDLPPTLLEMSRVAECSPLKEFASRWERVVLENPPPSDIRKVLPGLIEWVHPLKGSETQVLYLIWHRPWMAIAPNTFIGSMLAQIGWADRLPSFDQKYPEIDLNSFDPEKTLLLCSSEPFPFLKRRDVLKDLPFATAIIDGEIWSWFGIRSLRFLEVQRGFLAQ